MPLPLTISCFSKIQFNFTFLVPTHRGSPRQRAIKQVLRIHEKLVGKREASKFPTRLPTHFTCGNFMMKSLKGGIELMTHCRRAANVNSNISPRRSDPRSSTEVCSSAPFHQLRMELTHANKNSMILHNDFKNNYQHQTQYVLTPECFLEQQQPHAVHRCGPLLHHYCLGTDLCGPKLSK